MLPLPPATLFVTGTPRSGTTLLDKIVSLHPETHVLSQPLPLLYVEVKRKFLAERLRVAALSDLEYTFPLGDMFGPIYYPSQLLVDFLRSQKFPPEFYTRQLESMVNFSGQYTKPDNLPALIRGLSEDQDLINFVRYYTRAVAQESDNVLVGAKETYCEEYIPYFLDCGAKVILLMRDPRDTLTSLNFGEGTKHVGRRRPILFNLRQWRKAAAFGLAFADDPRFLVVRYEDLVSQPNETMAQVADFLELREPFGDLRSASLVSPSGEPWLGNSSHVKMSHVDPSSVGRWRGNLDQGTEAFLEAACLAEMRAFGYSTTLGTSAVECVLDEFEDKQPLEREVLRGYLWDESHLAEERHRWRNLSAGVFEPAQFQFEASFRRLRAVIGDIDGAHANRA